MGSPEIRAESFALEVLDNHTIVISCETAVDPENFTLRLSRWHAGTVGSSREAQASGEYGDLVIKITKPMLDGADMERPDKEWCFVCQEWFPKGSHTANDPDPEAPTGVTAPKAVKPWKGKRG